MNKLLEEALREMTDPVRRENVDWDKVAGKMTPEELFSVFCQWHGLIGWAPTLVQVWKECETLGRKV